MRPAIAWSPFPYILGEGLRTTAGDRTVEIIPYAGEDGRGEVAGHVVCVDFQRWGFARVPGPIEAAIAAAEGWIDEQAGVAASAGGVRAVHA